MLFIVTLIYIILLNAPLKVLQLLFLKHFFKKPSFLRHLIAARLLGHPVH